MTLPSWYDELNDPTVYGPGPSSFYDSSYVDEDGTDLSYLVPPWLAGTPMWSIWVDAYTDTGDPMAAIEAVRASEEYDIYFPGNRREDGTIRLEEGEYRSRVESYEDSLVAAGLSRDFVRQYFGDDFVALIEGNVSGDEFWQTRVMPVYERVTQASDAIRAEYAESLGIELTNEAIFASILNPEVVWQGLLDKTISMAEIRGAYRERWSDIEAMDTAYFDALYSRGDIDLNSARSLFAAADAMVPAISVLAARHADPDDDFDLNQFTMASVWNDPTQVSRMRRLIQSERASFAQAGSQVDWLRNRITGAEGLVER